MDIIELIILLILTIPGLMFVIYILGMIRSRSLPRHYEKWREELKKKSQNRKEMKKHGR